jgi:hypothetical protein
MRVLPDDVHDDETPRDGVQDKASVSDFVRVGAATARADAPASPRDEALTSTLLGFAFLMFGLALGELAGLSVVQGISQTLLTSLMTFVGGVLLSYAGFRRPSQDGKARLDPRRVAVGLGGLALALSVGLPAGLYTRCNVRVQSFFLGENVAHSQCSTQSGAVALYKPLTSRDNPGASALGLQSGEKLGPCQAAIKALDRAALDPTHTTLDITSRLSTLVDSCGLRRP